ncbi:MAG: 30S ribosomal protein S12 methylthiotransferase RimO [Clostridia bacterium]|nr:30S ribosomal protein S12 methylthiotransferase RimO [Clostridia bacterium]
MKKVAVISLGCDKNRVDTEHMLYRISRGGHAICDVDDADVVIVNTCAFIESARQESIDVILSCAELKKTGKLEKLIVTGCLPQKYRDELIAELPEVDAFLGAFEYSRIEQIVNGAPAAETAATVQAVDRTERAEELAQFYADENVGRLLSIYPHVAYVKIAEGCNNKCTFCTIPSIRGAYRSRRIPDIVRETESLVKDGVEEIILVAQDVTRFGSDRGRLELTELLTELEKTAVKRIRLLYCYPETVTDELIQKIASSDKIVNYIDVPLQHCNDRILKLMNRRVTRADIDALTAKLREHGIAMRTTLMVGFPSETEEEFNELVEFVKSTRPQYAGVFAYSKEDGTPAARLKGHLTKAVKLKRVDALGAACAAATRAFNDGLVGKTVDVVYEDVDYDKGLFIGRADFQSPDVDGRVYFTAKDAVDVGKTYKIEISDCDDYDLYGQVKE